MITIEEMKEWQRIGRELESKYCILFFDGEKINVVYTDKEDIMQKVLADYSVQMHIGTLLL